MGAGCSDTDKCFKYNPSLDDWYETEGTLTRAKVSYRAADYTAAFGLAMAQHSDPLEVTKDGVTFELLAEYPNPDVDDISGWSGCLVILDDKNLFLAGGYVGYEGSARAYIFNKDNNAWREVGSMADPREGHSCGLVRSTSSGKMEVIVVGGRGADESGSSTELKKSTEIFSVEDETWRPGISTCTETL